MKQMFILVFVVFILTIENTFSQTNIAGGEVTGIWEKTNSPYKILGNITIPDGGTLTIESGVEVIFEGQFKLDVKGRLLAIGTKTDSINLYSTTSKWKGIKFHSILSTNDSSKLVYCNIFNSHAISSDFPRSANMDDFGGGISVYNYSKLLIQNCAIHDNEAYEGGSLYAYASDITLINCSIYKNKAFSNGAFRLEGFYSSSKVIGCVIRNNITQQYATLSVKSGQFLNNTVCNNKSLNCYEGQFSFGNVTVMNNIFYYNLPNTIYLNYQSNNFSLTYNNIEGGFSSINKEFPSSIVEYKNNLEMIPYFNDTSKADYSLKDSPCINSGNPDFTIGISEDFEGNPRIFQELQSIIDIGAYESQNEIINRSPYISPSKRRYFLKNQNCLVRYKYFEVDNNELSFQILSDTSNVDANIIEVNDTAVFVELSPLNIWQGSLKLYLTVNDNTNNSNSIYTDTLLVTISDSIKGIIDYDVIFKDTVKVIGDLVINKNASLNVLAGAYIQFLNLYFLKVYGDFQVLGEISNNVTFSALDTLVDYQGFYRNEHGWGGIELRNVKNIKINHCNIENTGFWRLAGTVNIYNSENISFRDCVFRSNYATYELNNSGITLIDSKNIQVKNCLFTDGCKHQSYGIYINSLNSTLDVDSCTFQNNVEYDIRSETDPTRWRNPFSIYLSNSDAKIYNCHITNMNCGAIYSFGDAGNIIEGNTFSSNQGNAIISWNSDIIRNNIITYHQNYRDGIIHLGYGRPKVVNNIIAFNRDNDNVGNFFASAISLTLGCDAVILNNTIVGNVTDSWGKAIYSTKSSPLIMNNILWNNTPEGYGWYNGVDNEFKDPIFSNNVIENFDGDSKLGVNFNFDPQFVNVNNLDFSLNKDSKCINKGILDNIQSYLPIMDIYDNFRIDTLYKKIDIGAIEYQGPVDTLDSIDTTINTIEKDRFLKYPNVRNNKLIFSQDMLGAEFAIYDLSGKLILSKHVYNSEIDISFLNDGIYVLIVKKNYQNIIRKKLLIFR